MKHIKMHMFIRAFFVLINAMSIEYVPQAKFGDSLAVAFGPLTTSVQLLPDPLVTVSDTVCDELVTRGDSVAIALVASRAVAFGEQSATCVQFLPDPLITASDACCQLCSAIVDTLAYACVFADIIPLFAGSLLRALLEFLYARFFGDAYGRSNFLKRGG